VIEDVESAPTCLYVLNEPIDNAVECIASIQDLLRNQLTLLQCEARFEIVGVGRNLAELLSGSAGLGLRVEVRLVSSTRRKLPAACSRPPSASSWILHPTS
jgi:hypothetical protein